MNPNGRPLTGKTVLCSNCGAPLYRAAWRLRRQSFCPQKCQYEFQSKHKSGANSHRWKGGINKINGRFYVTNNRKRVARSRFVAEKALGRQLPRSIPVHHVDLDKTNDSNSNLVICQNTDYHNLLHARTRIVKLGGHPRIHKICGYCQQLKMRSEFSKRKDGDGLLYRCKSCDSDYQAVRRIMNKNKGEMP